MFNFHLFSFQCDEIENANHVCNLTGPETESIHIYTTLVSHLEIKGNWFYVWWCYSKDQEMCFTVTIYIRGEIKQIQAKGQTHQALDIANIFIPV